MYTDELLIWFQQFWKELEKCLPFEKAKIIKVWSKSNLSILLIKSYTLRMICRMNFTQLLNIPKKVSEVIKWGLLCTNLTILGLQFGKKLSLNS